MRVDLHDNREGVSNMDGHLGIDLDDNREGVSTVDKHLGVGLR